MANLPVAFADLLGGGILLAAGLYSVTPGDVVTGKLPASLPGFAGGTPTTTGTGTSGTTGTSNTGTSGTATGGKGSIMASLFPAGMHINISRHDQGRDLEGTPGAPVIAPGSGHLIRNGSDPSGFGDSYPIVHFDTGPWAGLDVYFGHIQSALSGGAFAAGTVIGHLQNGSGPYVGNAAGIPGHIEIGLAPGGSPGPFGQTLPPGL